MSRLDYAPKLKEIEVTDFKKGLGVFTPNPGKPVSFSALKETLKKAGYTLASADITVAGKLARDDEGWAIIVQASGQRFALEGQNVDQALGGAKEGDAIELTGNWRTIGTGPNADETITVSARKTLRVVVRIQFRSSRRWASRTHRFQRLFLRRRRPTPHP